MSERADFTAALLRFTVDNADRCTRNWLVTVCEWMEREVDGAVLEEREACALLHEQIDLDKTPQGAVIEYRDKIRARQPHD